MGSDMEVDIVTKQGNVSNEFLPVRDSDLQLEEETEKLPSADTEKGLTATEQLNIRAFKILEILRKMGKEKDIRDSQSLEPITSVCSRSRLQRQLFFFFVFLLSRLDC